jgi:hypothetical protein
MNTDIHPINVPCGFVFLLECFSRSSYLRGLGPSLITEQIKWATWSRPSTIASMPSDDQKQHTATIANDDEKLLAELGYKQEFQRAFTPLEACYVIIAYVISPLNLPKRCSVSRSASLDSCPQLRQPVVSFFSSTTLFTIRPQLSFILLRS